MPIQLDAQLTLSLKKVATEYDMDLSVVMMAGWSAVLARLSTQDDIVIGYHHSGPGGLEDQQADNGHIWPLRLDLSSDQNISKHLERVRKMATSSMDHEGLPLDGIAEIAGSPLFQVALRWNQAPLHSAAQVQVEIELELQEQDNEVVGNMRFYSALFNPDTIERHIGYLRSMLQAIAADTDQPVMSVDILSQAERGLILRKWNETEQVYPADLCVHQLFEQQVERTPQATALVFNGQSMTYIELNERANRLAHHLIELGVKPDGLVAICLERSFAMIVGVLAVLKARGAYVPLDPSYPSERLAYILEDAAPRIALVDAVGRTTLSEANQHLQRQKDAASMTMVDPNVHLQSSTVNPKALGLTSHHLAYIVYTSGSTGKPKGVMIEHQGVVNFALSRINDYGLDTSSQMLQFSSLNFDLSVMETFTAFYSGASLHLLEDRTRLDRQELWRYIEQHAITQAILPPAILQECKNCSPLSTKLTLISCGEELPATLLRALQPLIPNGSVINEYGPSETAIGDIAWRSPKERFDGDVVPIGRPIDNKKIYILDRHGQPIPTGSIGELYIGGVGVARGYLNRPDLTSKAFLPDPFSRDKNARMYKTGDLARYLPNGNIIFLGRNDHQVKIRGFRIELGEIETRLVDHPLVDKAAVIAIGEGSHKKLVGYVVANPDDNLVNTLRSHLTSCLPGYVVPAAIVRLDSLPINSNGKLDRKALPAPGNTAFARQDYEAPQGEIETAVAEIWANLLHLDCVSRNDDFFALGGHSLLAARMIYRLRQLGLATPISQFYQSPILSVLAQALENLQSQYIPPNLITPQTTVITPEMLPLITLSQAEIDRVIEQTPGGVANIQDIYSLSPFQDGILFHHLLSTEGDLYLSSAQMSFETRDLLDRYLQAFQQVVDRHDRLRTAFIWKNTSTPAQVVWRQAPLTVQELKLDSADGPIPKQLDELFHLKHYRIDLTQAPLIQFMIAQDTEGRWILLQLMSHIIGDRAAVEIMYYEIEQILLGQGHNLPTPHPFRNAIAQIRSESHHDHESFFNGILGDIEEPTFPFGMAEVRNNGTLIAESHSILPQELNNRLRFQAKQMGVSLASLCHVAWSLVLARTSGKECVVFGTVLFGGVQNNQVDGHTMGIFINALPFRCDINSQGARDCIRQTHARLAALLERLHASLALAQKCSGVPAGTPLFSSILNYLHTSLPSGNCEGPDMEFVSEEEQMHYPGIKFLGGRERTNYPLGINVLDFETALGLAVQSQHPIDPSRVESYMKQALESLVVALENDPNMAVSNLDVLPPEEHKQLLHGFNAVQQDYPSHLCVHHLFEQQVEHNPQATALVLDEQSVTYSELNSRANKLAHHLIEMGVRTESLVAICVKRSFSMVVALLAVLKAGGAYVPLDPSYASERLLDILTDASPGSLIADDHGKKALGEDIVSSMIVVDPNTMEVDSDKKSAATLANPHVPGLTSSNLVYIIYTSGSTGEPKGVTVEHQGLVNLVATRPEIYGISASSRMTQFFSLAFDAHAFDVFMMLCTGGSLHILSDTIRMDLPQLWDYLERESITHTVLTPAVLQHCNDLPRLSKPLTLITTAEATTSTLIKAMYRLIPDGKVINGYGPTETTVSAMAWECPRDFDGDNVPIGRPIANKTLYLLDEHRKPVPLGAIGELYIGGVGVARGYLNRPELTSKAFLPDPFAGDKDARMYKTGDLGRYLPDGNIVFLGRNDHQVKIRGFRIELGEIEARLGDHPLVDKAAVITTGEGANKKLVGYVVARPDDDLLNTLRSYLTLCLPEYMVPAAIVRLDSLPINSNGKLDRKALPAPDSDAFPRQIYEAPQGKVETTIAHIWAELLNIDR
ncbi:hypothetical protein BGX34_001376, partial [Mortierella sp. NVP85]